jgi:hypothetical protein
MATWRETVLRAVRFERPERIPMVFHINSACWHAYEPDALQDLMEAHPLLFPGFRRSADRAAPAHAPNAYRGRPYTDPWGCVWETCEDGIVGAVTGHPLADDDALDTYTPPDPETTDGTFPIDWARVTERLAKARENGGLCAGGLPHGHTFLRLQDLRGYAALLLDFADDNERARRLTAMVEQFNAAVVRKYLSFGVEWMSYPEDLGMQRGPMISPELFRRFIRPSYERLTAPAKEAGCIVHMHSDGDIRALLDDLMAVGFDVLNLQDLVNGIDRIRGTLKGRVCIDLDIDRQVVTRFGTPEAIDALIREEVTALGSPEGGLMMIFGLYPGTPLANVAALMDAMERYAGHWS